MYPTVIFFQSLNLCLDYDGRTGGSNNWEGVKVAFDLDPFPILNCNISSHTIEKISISNQTTKSMMFPASNFLGESADFDTVPQELET